MSEITTRLLVVSPHLDDGIFGCGALLASHPDAALATVFTAIPRVHADAGPNPDFITEWDSRCGFCSSREAMRARLAEDDAALEAVDAAPIRMAFYDCQYGRHAGAPEIAKRLEQVVAAQDFDIVLFPLGLFHADHLLVSDAACITMARQRERAWFCYEDALYRRMAGLVEQRLATLAASGLRLQPSQVLRCGGMHPRQRRALKAIAVHHYASQLHAFGPAGYRDVFAPERFWRVWP